MVVEARFPEDNEQLFDHAKTVRPVGMVAREPRVRSARADQTVCALRAYVTSCSVAERVCRGWTRLFSGAP